MNKNKGTISNSKVYSDEQGDYIIASKDLEGNIHKVYISYLSNNKT